MKRHAASVDGAMESGQAGRNISMMPPNIQPYQASGRSAQPSASSKAARDSWQKNAAIAVAIWIGGWFLGYGMLWPLYLALQALSAILSFTPFGSMLDWFTRTGPAPDLFPTANELRIPNSQVGRYMESYVQSYGDAALIFAAHDGYSQLVTGLMLNKELGYTDLIDAADESGHTALLYAAGRGFPQVAAALLQNGADPDAPKQGKDGRGLTPLMEAAGTGHRDIVTLLLKANATVDQLDEQGNTALMYAAANGNLGVLQELLQRGAMRDTANRRGDSALSMATANGHQAIVDALQRGARPVVEKRARGAQSNVRLPDVSGRKGKDKETRPKASPVVDEEKVPETKSPKVPAKEAASSVASWFSKDPDSAAAPSPSPADGKRIKDLEKQLEELKRTHEAADLKSQRRIVELLEASTSKQKLVDQADQERKDFEIKLEELKKKLRAKEAQSEEDDERTSRLSKEAHEARIEVEKERSRAEAAERERDRVATELKRLETSAKQRSEEQEEQDRQVERLKARVKALREEADHAEEERRTLQAKMDEMRSAHSPEHAGGPEPAGKSSSEPPAVQESSSKAVDNKVEQIGASGIATPAPAQAAQEVV